MSCLKQSSVLREEAMNSVDFSLLGEHFKFGFPRWFCIPSISNHFFVGIVTQYILKVGAISLFCRCYFN